MLEKRLYWEMHNEGKGEAYELILRIILTFSEACLARSSGSRFFSLLRVGNETSAPIPVTPTLSPSNLMNQPPN
jgi:hypothetical protein